MARQLLQTRISLDSVHCHRESDGVFDSSEPYLWTVFFKIDGDSTFVGDDYFLKGECQIITSDGSHGNLGDHDVDAGDDVVIPHAIGEVRTTLRPIPLSPVLQGQFPDEDARGGAIGVVFVLLEENLGTDAGARAGYAALCDFVKREVDKIIPTLTIGNDMIGDDKIAVLLDQAIETVKQTIRDIQDASEDFWSWVNGDEPLGFRVLRFYHDELANNYWDINERLVSLTEDGHVKADWQVFGEAQGVDFDARGYAHARRSEDVGAPPATGVPTTCLRPSGGQSIVYRARTGHLHELSRDAIGQLGTRAVTAEGNAPLSAGNPFVYLETTTDNETALFRSTSGVHALYWSTGAVGLDNLSFVAGSPAAASDVVGTFNPSRGLHHIAYRSSDGLLHVIYSAGGTDPAHYEGPLTTAVPGGAPRAVGDPSLYFDSGLQNIVVYRGADSNVHSIYWSLDEPGHDRLSEVVGTPQAAGNPVAYHLPHLDLHQVTYRGVDGNIWEISWRGVEVGVGRNLTGDAGAPPASEDPAVYYSPGTNRKHVVYRGPFGHLLDVSFVPGERPTWVDLTLEARAPRAVGRPAAFTVDSADTHYVVYVGTDHQVHEISWVDTSWDRTSAQAGWRWCNKCQGMFYGILTFMSRCPAGGTHNPPQDPSFSTEYHLPYNVPGRSSAQGDWRWCNNCQGLYYGPGMAASRCPSGGTHTPPAAGAFDYHLSYGISGVDGTQGDWRWCSKCQGLFYGGGVATSRCPAGGTHARPAVSGSFDYVLPFTWTAVVVTL